MFRFFVDHIKIPLAKLLLESGSSYAALRRLALQTLFKHSNSGEIPSYALETFGTYERNGKEIELSRNEDITNALEVACTENGMQAVNSVILDIKCVFVNTYENKGILGRFASMIDEKLSLLIGA